MMKCFLSAAFAYALSLSCVLQSYVASAETPRPVRLRMFNGDNLDGWQVVGCDAAAQNGSLVLRGGTGIVRSDHRYADFLLELKWRARSPCHWDSGIFFRCNLPQDGRAWPESYQVDLKEGREGTLEGMPRAECRGLVCPGQWNDLRLTVIGDWARLAINGHVAWTVEGILTPAGYIALECNVPGGGPFEFKEIYVTELNHRWLFDGQDFSGWEGAGADASACWKVDEGLLLCTGEKGPWLRSKRQFQDFNLRLEYKLKEGGNSGVYVRVPEDGNHHGDGAGVEVQILDDQAARYRQLKPYQYTGSLYAIAPAQMHVARPPEQWNSLEIDCLGTNYSVTHNGHRIVNATASDYPQLQGRRRAGYLGLQNHSEQVWFRNIRIGTPIGE